MKEHPHARFIVDTLTQAGFVAYYAGGWVRDFLLHHPSEDIDIATSATPEMVLSLFPKTVPVGIAFGIVLVLIEGHPYEVATFRQDRDYKDGRRPSRILFATPVEDAKRRDFTINGMFYDPIGQRVLDFVGGQNDLKQKIVRAIGNPHERIREDRLRMLRACRLSCRFGFTIEPETERAIVCHAKELFPAVAIERVVQELSKALASRVLGPMLLQLHRLGLLHSIFPDLAPWGIKELQTILQPLTLYPPQTPLIAHLLPLFPGSSFEEQRLLAERLKRPNTELNFLHSLHRLQETIQRGTVEKVDWARLYLHPMTEGCLSIVAAHRDDRTRFMEEHDKRKRELAYWIEAMRQHRPWVGSQDLVRLGIAPGPVMGKLLREAERIAVNEGLKKGSEVLDRLRRSPMWPGQSESQ